MRGRGGDVGGEAERARHQRHVDDAAADPEEAGEEADPGAVEGAAGERHAVAVDARRRRRRVRGRGRAARDRPIGVRAKADHDHREDRQHRRHDQVEDAGRHQVDGERAEDRAGDPGGGEAQAGAVVDPPHPGVGERARERVEEDDQEADRGDLRRRQLRVDDQQNRGEDEAAARPDQGAEGADREAEQG